MNSARLVDVVLAFEDEFDIEIADEDVDAVETVADCVSLIQQKLRLGAVWRPATKLPPRSRRSATGSVAAWRASAGCRGCSRRSGCRSRSRSCASAWAGASRTPASCARATGACAPSRGRRSCVCANHLTLVDSFLVAWALGSPSLVPAPLLGAALERARGAELRGQLVEPRARLRDEVPADPARRRPQGRRARARAARPPARPRRGRPGLPGGRAQPQRPRRADAAAYGVGRLVKAVPGCRVLCVYLRGARPGDLVATCRARGERFHVALAALEPKSDAGGPARLARRSRARSSAAWPSWRSMSMLGNDVVDLADPEAARAGPPPALRRARLRARGARAARGARRTARGCAGSSGPPRRPPTRRRGSSIRACASIPASSSRASGGVVRHGALRFPFRVCEAGGARPRRRGARAARAGSRPLRRRAASRCEAEAGRAARARSRCAPRRACSGAPPRSSRSSARAAARGCCAGGGPSGLALSLSHHGRFVAFALAPAGERA